jgi:hypothetical protein
MRASLAIPVVLAVLAVGPAAQAQQPVTHVAASVVPQTKPAAPQTKPAPSQKPKTPPPRRGFRVFGAAEIEYLTATDTFDAVSDLPVLIGYGGGVELENLIRRLFVRLSITTCAIDAEHGLVVDGSFIPTGVPFDIGMRTVEFGGGWRFGRATKSFYAGAGLTLRKFTEKTDGFPEEDVAESHNGYYANAGFDFRVAPKFFVGLEGFYRKVDAGEGTALMRDFNESDLGGAGARILFAFKVK